MLNVFGSVGEVWSEWETVGEVMCGDRGSEVLDLLCFEGSACMDLLAQWWRRGQEII